VVDNHTGVLAMPLEVVVPMSGCNHVNMCRFPSSESNQYRLVLRHIEGASAGNLTRYSYFDIMYTEASEGDM
jgi:hypothetical protein